MTIMENFGSNISIDSTNHSHISFCTEFISTITPPPNPPSNGGSIVLSNVSEEGFSVEFGEAIEGGSSISRYDLYISEENNLSDVESIESNGVLIEENLIYNDIPVTVTGLNPDSKYWVNVIVTDENGLKTSYISNSISTQEITMTITADTVIRITYDGSGSMQDSTITSLQEMIDNNLKDILLPIYNNDEDLYAQKVVLEKWNLGRTFNKLLGKRPDIIEGIVHIFFQCDAAPAYHTDSYSSRTEVYDNDITSLRRDLDYVFLPGTYKGVVFQVNSNHTGYHVDVFPDFLKAVENGEGEYAPPYGLSDKDRVSFVYDVDPEEDPQYYADLIRQEIGI